MNSKGPIAGWDTREVLGARSTLRLASQLELPPENDMLALAFSFRMQIDESPSDPYPRDTLATVDLALSAVYIQTDRFQLAAEALDEAIEQHRTLEQFFGPSDQTKVPLAALYYNASILQQLTGDAAGAEAFWRTATAHLGHPSDATDWLVSSRILVENALLHQKIALGLF